MNPDEIWGGTYGSDVDRLQRDYAAQQKIDPSYQRPKELLEEEEKEKEKSKPQEEKPESNPVKEAAKSYAPASGYIEGAEQLIQAGIDNAPKIVDGITGAISSLGDRDFSKEQTTENAIKDGVKNAAYQQIAAPLAILDFGLDSIGRVPATQWIDDAWDEKTKFQDPTMAGVRDVLSVIVPSVAASMVLTPAAGKAVSAINGGKVATGLAKVTTALSADVAIAQLSDYSERDEGLMRSLDDFMESIGRPLDLKIPDSIKVLDGDSPQLRRNKLSYEAAGLSIIADVLTYSHSAGKAILNWFKPKDDVARTFKEVSIRQNPDPDTVFRTMELDEEIAQLTDEIAASSDPKLIKELTAKRDDLAEENAALFRTYFKTGSTSATADPLASVVQQAQSSRGWQIDEVGADRLKADPTNPEIDPFVQSKLTPDTLRPAVQSIPRATVQKNAADVAAIELGVVPPNSVPAPLTTPAYEKGMGLRGPAREKAKALVDSLNAGGKHDAVVDGATVAYQQMEEAALNYLARAIEAPSVDELKEVFKPALTTKQITEELGVEVLRDDVVRPAFQAIKALNELYFGREVTAMSGRMMMTTAKEIETILDAKRVFKSNVNEDAIDDVVLDKLGFLTEIYGISKNIGSKGLSVFKHWRKQDPVVMKSQMDIIAKQKKAEAAQFINDVRILKKENPEVARTLFMAYDATDGDVNSMAKLTAWVRTQNNPLTFITGGGEFGNVTVFAENAWGVIYNNVLSGLSALKAMKGTVSALALKPVNYLLGTSAQWAFGKASFDDIRKGFYAYGIQYETVARATSEFFSTLKKASNNPEAYKAALRKDYGGPDISQMEEVLERAMGQKEFASGQGWLYKWNMLNKAYANSKFARYGTNLMLAGDKASQIYTATMASKFRAWEEVYQKGQKLNVEELLEAQQRHYDNVFDSKTDLIKDSWVKQVSADVALNEEMTSQMGRFLTGLNNMHPSFRILNMFPNTGFNDIRKKLTYIPFASIPGASRNARTILAKSQDEIDEVMRLHGIDINDPDKMTILKNLKAEYIGRLMFGSALSMAGINYAMAGNIRGDYPADAKTRNYLISQKWKPKTINIGGNWVSYEGIEMIDPIFTMLGNLSYNLTDVSSPVAEDLSGKIAWMFSNMFVGATPLEGLEPIVGLLLLNDESAMQRLINNFVRQSMPMSSAQSVIVKAIDGAAKETYKDSVNYFASRLVPTAPFVPDKYDIWTGQKIYVIDNPWLRALNAINPLAVSQGEEPWRVWINSSGYNASQLVLKDSSGHHTYTSAERSRVAQLIGEQEPWREIEKLMKVQKYNDQIAMAKLMMRKNNWTWDELSVNQNDLEVVDKINKTMNRAKEFAENKFLQENPAIQSKINDAKRIKQLMQAGKQSEADALSKAARKRFKESKKAKQLQQVQEFFR